ncbi:glycosyl hydrolases family 31-domain-containing protein [Gongronella butleri]|nr:glycosyl hydrolases family 31-domain-containing protein [Gongronella butleri]
MTMWSQALKAFGLAPMDEYIQPRISIGDRVLTNEFSTGNFKIQANQERLSFSVKTLDGRVLWESIHGEPFLASSVGHDSFGANDHGQLTIAEHDTMPTRLQTITNIAYDSIEKQVVHVSGGLSTKLVLPTHMDYVLSFKEISPRQLDMTVKITHRDPAMQHHQRLILTYKTNSDEQIYGFGEQYSSIDHKGQKVPVLVREQDQGRDASSLSKLWSSTKHLMSSDALATNCTVPFYMTSDCLGFCLLNSEYSSFDLRQPERVTVRVNASSLMARVMHGDSLFDLLSEYTAYAGRVASIPLWVGQGAIVDLQGGPDKVRQVLEQLRYYRVPLAAVCVSDWSGYLQPEVPEGQQQAAVAYPVPHWSMEYSSALYPDWPAFVQELTQHVSKPNNSKAAATLAVMSDGDENDENKENDKIDENEADAPPAAPPKDEEVDEEEDIIITDTPAVRLLVSVTPFLSATQDDGKVGTASTRDTLTHKHYHHAAANGYLVKQPMDGAPYLIKGSAGEAYGILDLTNESARQWFKDILKTQLFDIGISGYLADYGYTLPMDLASAKRVALSASQCNATDYHNQYAEDWTKLHHDLLTETGLDDHAVVFCRSGYIRSAGYVQSLWTGDQAVTWNQTDGIKSAVTAMLNAGLSGFSTCHCEIGGYMTADSGFPGTKMIRSKELLCRWMELAAFTCVFRTSEGLLPRANAQIYDDEESYLHLAHTANLFAALQPYRRQLLHDAKTKGWPVLRHLLMYYPKDTTVKQLTYQQFMVGSCLMVAPVLSPSTNFVKVYFPKNEHHIQWRHIWSGRVYESDGSYQAIDAPLGQPAAFVMEPRDQEPGGRALNDLLKFASSYIDQLAQQQQQERQQQRQTA